MEPRGVRVRVRVREISVCTSGLSRHILFTVLAEEGWDVPR